MTIIDQFTDEPTGLFVRTFRDDSGRWPRPPSEGAERVMVRLNGEWHTLEAATFECPCCGEELDP